MINRDIDPLAELRRAEASLPDSEAPLIRRTRERSREAVDIVTAAVAADPTLTDADRCRRDIDLLAELLRHLRVLARQAEQHRRAADELDALSARVVEIARRIAAAALPDWNTPARIRERSERLLPSRETLEEIADRLRRAVEPALLSHPAPEAVRLAALADQIARPTDHDPASPAGPDQLARDLEGVTPAQAYRIGVACGRLLALLESLNRRLDSHLLRLGIPQDQPDATADDTEQAAQSVPEATKTPGAGEEHKTRIRAAQIASQGQR